MLHGLPLGIELAASWVVPDISAAVMWALDEGDAERATHGGQHRQVLDVPCLPRAVRPPGMV